MHCQKNIKLKFTYVLKGKIVQYDYNFRQNCPSSLTTL